MSNAPQTIKVTCPGCGDVELGPGDITLVVCNLPDRSYYGFICPECREGVNRQATTDVISLLKHAGIVPQLWHIPLEAIEAHDGPPISYDDILTFALALERYKDQMGLIIALALPRKPAW